MEIGMEEGVEFMANLKPIIATATAHHRHHRQL